MKVKKFRIKPRLPSVGKILKGLLSVKQLPTEIEETLPQEAEQFVQKIIPTAFYSTWSNEDIPLAFRSALESHSKDFVAVSAVVATIGTDPDDILSELLMKGETTRSHVITAIAEESVELSFQFISRLLIEDAQQDSCEISPSFVLTEPTLLAETLTLLESGQENVSVDVAQHLTPRFTRVALFAWIPIKKRKRELTSSQKKLT